MRDVAIIGAGMTKFGKFLDRSMKDLTREAVAGHLRLPMHEDQAIVDSIARRFASRGWPMPDVNRRQAMVPEGAVVLDNPNGTAPGSRS